MKKILILMALMFTMVSANAQTAIETSTFGDNWSVGVNAGVTTPLDLNSVFPLNTVAGVTLQKNFTPIFGLRAEGMVKFGEYNVGERGFFPLATSKTFVKTSTVGLDAVFNLANLFKGYKGTPRIFEPSLVAGLGWCHAFNNDGIATPSNDFLTAKTAIDLALNFGNDKQFQVYAEPQVLWNLTPNSKVKFNKEFAQLGVAVGFVYKFKNSNGTHNFKVHDIKAMNETIAYLQGQLDECRKRPAVAPAPRQMPPVKPRIIEKPVGAFDVQFAFDSAELTEEAKTLLKQVPAGTEVTVEGFASNVGSASYNQTLSERRANAIAEFLQTIGVKVVEATGKGIVTDEANQKAVVNLKK